MSEGAEINGSAGTETETVSVVITCYNHGRFLREAIDSVVTQIYTNYEIILVDDGSTDDTSQIAAAYPGVRYIHQKNRGLAEARNTGIKHSTAKFIVFLDADDRLVNIALDAGIRHLTAHPECAFVSGRYSVIRSNGKITPQCRHYFVETDYYRELLRGNYIGMHGTVMYRRAIFKSVGGFDGSFGACEDYDMYLRIARMHSISCHDAVIAEYRHHADNMTRDHALMLKSSQRVLRRQRKYLRDAKETEAFASGIRFWQMFHGDRLIGELSGSPRHAIRNIPIVLRYHPRGFARLAMGLMGDLPRVFFRPGRRLAASTYEMAVQIYFSRWRGFKKRAASSGWSPIWRSASVDPYQ